MDSILTLAIPVVIGLSVTKLNIFVTQKLATGLEDGMYTLLLTANRIQRDDFHKRTVLKIRHPRVVKCNMPVFTDSQTYQIHRMRTQKIAVACALCLRVFRLTVDIMDAAEGKA